MEKAGMKFELTKPAGAMKWGKPEDIVRFHAKRNSWRSPKNQSQ